MIIRPAAAIERVFGNGFWTEGPALGPDGLVYFCDITMTFATGGAAGNIWAHDSGTGRTVVFRSPSGMAAGIKFDSFGRMVCTTGADFGSRSVIRTDMSTGRSMIAAGLHNGRPFNAPNDLDIDDQDRIYFTDPRYFGHEAIEQPVFGVYRVDPGCEAVLIIADIARPNGIALGLDQRSLYVVEHDIMRSDRRMRDLPVRNGSMRILRYDLSTAGEASNREVFTDFGAEAGADGIALDAKGRVYAAVRSATRPGVRIYEPDGREVAEIAIPEKPTNVALVTLDDGPWLYVTAGGGLYRVAVTTPGRTYGWQRRARHGTI